MLFKLHYLLVPLLIIAGCSTGPDLERDNENDPKSEIYSPNPPFGENYSINSEGNITLNWEDNTEYEDSYVIYKSIHSENDFKKIADLEANTTKFEDVSGLYGYPTIYKIISRKEEQESAPILVSIDMDNFGDFSFETTTDNVIITWNHHYDLDAKIAFKISSENQESETELGTAYLAENKFTFERPFDKLSYQFEVSLFFQNEAGGSYGPNKVYDYDMNVSSVKDYFYYSEDEVRLTLKNKFEAGSGYNLYRKNISNSTYTIVKTFGSDSEFIPIRENFIKDRSYTYAISTLLNSKESDLQEFTFKAVTPAVKLDKITSVNQTTVKINISDTTQINRQYQIYRSSGGNCYADWRVGELIAEIPMSEISYTDKTLDGNEEFASDYYCYHIRTKLSEFSNKIRVRYGNTVVPADSTVFSTSNGNFLSTNINTTGNLIAINSTSKISLYNTTDFSSWEINNLGFDQIVRISSDENLILTGNKDGTLKLMDLHSEEVLRNINFDSYGEIIDIRFSLLDDAFLILTEQGFYHLMGDDQVKTLVPSLEINSGYIYVGNSSSLILVGAEKNLYRWDLANGNLNRHNFNLEYNTASDINHIDYYVSEIRTNYSYTAMVSYVDNAGIDWDIDNGYGFVFEHSIDNWPLTNRRSIYVPKSDFRFTASNYEYHYQRLYNINQDLITYHDTFPILVEVINLGYLDTSELIAMIKKNDSEVIVYLLAPVRMWRSEDID